MENKDGRSAETQASAVIIGNLEKLLGGPRDGVLLRYSLGNEHLKAGDCERAAQYFRQAVERDATFSAAWKLLGTALAEAGDAGAALTAYEHGEQVARGKGDLQAAKEMAVFARRLRRQLADGGR